VVDGIAQCSIDPKINLTFNETLRHIVRQDPDVVVIDEIRDTFSAQIEVAKALSLSPPLHIEKNGQARVLRDHTYKNRAEEIVNILS